MNGPFKIGTLSRLTGFSPDLLRAWERRFGLLEPDRGPGGQRLYSDDDLAVLRRVRALLDQGRSIGEVARTGRDALRAAGQAPADLPLTATPLAPALPQHIAAWRQRLVASALALDHTGVTAALDEAFGILSPEQAVAEVIEPVALEVGHLWAAGRCSVSSEHLVSDQFLHRVRQLLDASQPRGHGHPLVIAACLPEEQHQLGLAILSWHVARAGAQVAYLGPAVPLSDLIRACQASHADVALLSVTRREIFDSHYPDVVAEFPSDRLALVGGQGVPAGAVDRPDGAVACVRGRALDAVVHRVVTFARHAGPRLNGR